MKRSMFLSLLLFLAVICLTSQSPSPPAEEEEEIDDAAKYRKEHPDAIPSHFEVCRSALQSPSANYRGLNLLSKSSDKTDLVICPGDTFGDLNGTYAKLEDCQLTMYHQGRPIWSSPKSDRSGGSSKFLCALTLQKDGQLTLWKEGWQCYGTFAGLRMHFLWGSNTGSRPTQTELRVHDQQLQLVQTFRGRNPRLFYTGENVREFREDLGAPRQVAKEFLIINHNDPDNVFILSRNEYIGDLNGIHLIFQTNCELQLKNKSQAIWSFAAYLKPDGGCDLLVQENSIGIPELPIKGDNYYYEYKGMIILPPTPFLVLQSNITFSGDQLLIIQTLKNGSEITFYSEPGQDNGLKLKGKLRQIAKNNITISQLLTMKRLEYIGNLDGLHLILQDNCAFTLANGQEELWKLTQHLEPDYKRIKNLDGPFMECAIQFQEDGTIMLNRYTNINEWYPEVQVFGERSYDIDVPPSRFQLSLENNLMIMTLESNTKPSKIYHAGANTNGTWLQFISNSSVIINANDTADEILPTMGYIGNIHGVFTMLNRRGNWVLFNQTRVIWGSGTTQEIESTDLHLVSTRNGTIALKYGRWEEMWSTRAQNTSISARAEFSKTELLVNNDGMWLINTFIDGTVDKYKALEGTNTFFLMSNESEFINT